MESFLYETVELLQRTKFKHPPDLTWNINILDIALWELSHTFTFRQIFTHMFIYIHKAIPHFADFRTGDSAFQRGNETGRGRACDTSLAQTSFPLLP